ncbi:TIGR03086 family metal-binding protein [Spirillospora sp. NPDC029432]|uniref:TIGR03086 family metal-binding protein n=1 Tax=Spirillospora sp. NPDC029432 TaxID=3154599 RepID=UPI0034537CE8
MTMSEADAAALRRYGSRLLERAAAFALETLDAPPPVAPRDLARPTPCAGWDLGTLLRHMDDSLAALHEAVSGGSVALYPPAGSPDGGDPVAGVRASAVRLLEAWRDPGGTGEDRTVTVAGCPMSAGIVAATGAVELAVHAWDVARARGRDADVPGPLAERLLRVTPLLVPGHARAGLFGPPLAAPPGSSPGGRLVAYLGRDPAYGQARTA